MATKTDIDFYSQIKEKEDILINELVEEFDAEIKPLLKERFDRIKFLFFTGIPNLKREITKKYSKSASITTLNFIKNCIGFNGAYIDDSFYELNGYVVDGDPRGVLNEVYGSNLIIFDLPNNLHNNIKGIWAFNPNINMEKIKKYGEYCGKTALEMLNSLKCSFLRYLKKYPEEYSDEQIIQDHDYEHICEYYSLELQKYIEAMEEHKKDVSEELELLNYLEINGGKIYRDAFRFLLKEALYPYLSDTDKKIVDSNSDFKLEEISMMHQIFYYNQELDQESKVEKMSDAELQALIHSHDNKFTANMDVKKIIKDAREQANKRAINYYNRLVIFSSNTDFSEESVDIDLSKLDGTMQSLFIQENGIEKERVIIFDPYACPDENYDVLLRHELRHSLTSSVSINKDGIVIVKVGNNLFYYLDDKLIDCVNTDFNEYFTQKMALENTKKAYEKGIYIITPPNIKYPTPITSGYDEYLPDFNKIYEQLSQKAKRSQIELTNDNLYREVSQESIKELENNIKYRKKIDEETLKKHIHNSNGEVKSFFK